MYSQHIFMDSILNFMEANKGQPFFLYFPTQLPHGPVSIPSVHPDFANDKCLSQIEKEYALVENYCCFNAFRPAVCKRYSGSRSRWVLA